MAGMWGDMERGADTRKGEMERKRIFSLETDIAEKAHEIEKLNKEAEKLRKDVDKAMQKCTDAEEECVLHKTRADGFETKVRRLESRADTAESELAIQERDLADLSGLRTQLRVTEQRQTSLRDQLLFEKKKTEEYESRNSKLEASHKAHTTARSNLQSDLESVRRECESHREKAKEYNDEITNLTAKTDSILAHANSEADLLREKVRAFERRLQKYDHTQRTMHEMDTDLEAANTRSRELTRLLAVEKAERGISDSQAADYKDQLSRVRRELSSLQGASQSMATRLTESDLSLLTARTAYTGSSLTDITKQQLVGQLAIEKREHGNLKVEFEAQKKELEILRSAFALNKHFDKTVAALEAVPSPLEGKYRTPRSARSGSADPSPSPTMPYSPPVVVDNSSPVWENNMKSPRVTLERRRSSPKRQPLDTKSIKSDTPRWAISTPPPTVKLTSPDSEITSDVSASLSSLESSQEFQRKMRKDSEAMYRRAAALDAQERESQAATTPGTSRLEALVTHQKLLAEQKALLDKTWLIPGLN